MGLSRLRIPTSTASPTNAFSTILLSSTPPKVGLPFQRCKQNGVPEDRNMDEEGEGIKYHSLRQTDSLSFRSEKIIRLIEKPGVYYPLPWMRGLKRLDPLHHLIATSDALHKAAGKDDTQDLEAKTEMGVKRSQGSKVPGAHPRDPKHHQASPPQASTSCSAPSHCP